MYVTTLISLIFASINFRGFRDEAKICENKDDIFAKILKPLSPFFSEIAKIKPRELRICLFREIKYSVRAKISENKVYTRVILFQPWNNI